MDATKCRAYNKTRKSLLCADATVVDADLDPLRVLQVLVEGLDPRTETGIYLKNFSGVPVAGALSPFDLIYLSQHDRVIQGVALSPDCEVMPFKGRAEAALVLPSGSIASSRTAAGDALTITPVEESASQSELIPAAIMPAQPAASTDWLGSVRSEDELIPAVAEEMASEPEVISISTTAEQAAESTESLMPTPAGDEHILVVAEEMVSEPEPISISTTPEQAAESTESLSPILAVDELMPAVAEEMVSQPELTSISTTPDQAAESAESLPRAGSDDELILVFADDMVSEAEPVSISTPPEEAEEGAESRPEQVLARGGFDASVAGDGPGQQMAVVQQLDEIEPTGLSDGEEPLEVQLRRLVAQKPNEKDKAGYRGWKDSLEVELRRLVTRRGSQLKRIRLWTSSVLAKGFSGSPARTNALKASHMGPVEWVGDQPRRASAAADSAPAKQGAQPSARKEPLKIRFLRRIDYFLRWLNYEEDLPQAIEEENEENSDQRRGERVPFPNMIAFHWTGGLPKPFKVGNISVSGFYLITDDRWSPGTLLKMTLQRANTEGDNPRDSITVHAKVVRWGPDGEGFEFVLTKLLE